MSPETSAFKLQTPGKFPEEYKLHSEHGESLKTTTQSKLFAGLSNLKALPVMCIQQQYRRQAIPVAARSNAWVCGRSPAGIVGLSVCRERCVVR